MNLELFDMRTSKYHSQFGNEASEKSVVLERIPRLSETVIPPFWVLVQYAIVHPKIVLKSFSVEKNT